VAVRRGGSDEIAGFWLRGAQWLAGGVDDALERRVNPAMDAVWGRL
jgi:hypothetical protein